LTRVVFMGTPDFAVPSLRALLDAQRFDVVGVVTRPDRPAGRGRALRESAVKGAALEAGVPLFQPGTLRKPEAVARLAEWAPEVIVVAAFGQILRPDVLDLPTKGCVNMHASLLPRWRGAAPIQAAIRAGDVVSGVTIMRMDAGLDTGPILGQRQVPLEPCETFRTLHDKLAALGAELLAEVLPAYIDGQIAPQPQPDDEALVTLAPTIKKEDGKINWARPAEEIDRQVRAYDPWPGTFSTWQGRTLKVLAGRPLTEGDAPPGLVVETEAGIAVGTGRGLFLLERLQLEGRKPLGAEEFLRGRSGFVGRVLGVG
jgi:methionyl-tRNA formyltransferase